MLYTAHFGLHEPPFGLTPDTGFFLPHPRYQAVLNTLLVAVQSGEGFVKITGEVGTGKTLMCRQFMNLLDERMVTAYLPNPQLAPRALLQAVGAELALPPAILSGDEHRLRAALADALLEHARAGRRVVLCVDEAQAMPLRTLEALRLLSNLETEKHKLLQIVLFGQPELDEHLAHPGIRQLAQRIGFQDRLTPLDRTDLADYLAHRLRTAGHPDGRVFGWTARRALLRSSGGVPRLVNILANKSLMLCHAAGRESVRGNDVRAAARDTPAARRLPSPAWRLLASAALLGASGAGLVACGVWNP